MAAQSKKILLASDKPDPWKLERKILQSKRFELILAKSGRETLEQCQAHHPLLCIIDQNLPDMLGSEVCEKIKSHTDTAPTRVLIKLDKSTTATLDQCFNAQCDHIILPSNSEKEFLEKLALVLAGKWRITKSWNVEFPVKIEKRGKKTLGKVVQLGLNSISIALERIDPEASNYRLQWQFGKESFTFWARYQKMVKTSSGKNAALFYFLSLTEQEEERIKRVIPQKRGQFQWLGLKALWISLLALIIFSGIWYLIYSRIPKVSEEALTISLQLKTPIPFQKAKAQSGRLILHMKPEWAQIPLEERKILSQQALTEIASLNYERLIILDEKGQILGIGSVGKGVTLRN